MMPVEKHQVIPNDTYFNNQFYLRNTGQVFNPVENHSGTVNADINASFAWNTTLGNSNIIVAVIDEGLTPDHLDLPNTRQVRLIGSNFVPGEDVNNPTPDLNNNHGNSCSGIIAATQNNNEGITGIAPNVRIMPIKVFGLNGNNADNNGFASAIDFAWQNGAHVISNSWGFQGVDNPNFVPAIVAAINRAVTQGRGGLGCVVAFSASNSAHHSFADNGVVGFPSNVQINGVLTVGASDRDDQQADYSPTSNVASANNQIIDIVAPSHRAYPPAFGGIAGEGFEVWTIDIPGANGYNQWNDANFPGTAPAFGEVLPTTGTNNLSYTGRMGGTSAACPQVAAVAALILSVNNNLTQQQVFDFITQSAEKVGGYTYNANGWCPEIGNGRLNACAALSMIPERYAITGLDAFCNSTTYSVAGLPTGSTVVWSSSNTNIATVTQGNTTTANKGAYSGGVTTLTATIAIPNRCGVTISTKSVIVGTGANSIYYTQKIMTCVGRNAYFYGTVQPVPGATNYDWYARDESNPGNPFVLEQTGLGNQADFPLSGSNKYFTIRVVVTNPCGTLTSIDEDGYIFAESCSNGGASIRNSSGTTPEKITRFSIFPNPVKTMLHIEIPSDSIDLSHANMRLLDINGKLLKRITKVLERNNIPITDVASGVYLVEITDGKKRIIRKVIKH